MRCCFKENEIKDEWFCEVICGSLFKNTDEYELSDWIEEILNSEFDTICEDGTLVPTAKLLVQMSNWLLVRGKDDAETARQKLEENIQKLKGISNKQVSSYLSCSIS